MNSLFNLTTQARSNGIQPPKASELLQSAVIFAFGSTFASVCVCNVPALARLLCLIIGGIICAVAIGLFLRYCAKQKAFQSYTPNWDTKRGIFDRFAFELNNWYAHEELPESCDGDTAYFLKLQRERLSEKKLTMTQQILPVKGDNCGTTTLPRKTIWYTSDTMYETACRHIAFHKNDEMLYQRDVEETMYETVIHSPNEEQLDNMLLTCPNCGAVSPVAELTQGCRYCNTQFHIHDLYPRVTNLYFVRMNSTLKSQNIMRHTMTICITGCFLFFLICSCISYIKNGDTSPFPLTLLLCYFESFFCGGILGFLASDILLIASLFDHDGRKRIPFFKSLSARSRLKSLIGRYDRYFSIDKFEGQIISLIRMAVFAKDPANLTSYKGTTLDPRFHDIVEMTHISSFVIQKVRQANNILHITLRTWWINYNEADGKITKTGDCIDVTISKDISHADIPGFSITSVNCHNCGGSFDAVRQHICPYCQTEYHMEQDNWIIEDMKLIR